MSKLQSVVLLVAFLLAGCTTPLIVPVPASLPAPTPIAGTPQKTGTLRYFTTINAGVRDVPILVAMDDLRAQGYTVEYTELSGSSLIAEALQRGDADVGAMNTQTMWTAIAKGTDARTIAQAVKLPQFVIARKEITSCAELDDKPMGVSAVAGLNPSLLNFYMQEHCPAAEPQRLILPEAEARITGLLSGELVASQMNLEDYLKLDQEAPDKFHVLIPISASYPKVLSGTLHARSEWAEQNRVLVKDLLRAILVANRRLLDDPQFLLDESARRLNMNPALAKILGEAYLKFETIEENGALTQDTAQYTLDFIKSIEGLPQDVTLEQVVDLTYLNEVLDEIGRR